MTEEMKATHKSIAAALASAQADMGKALKTANNPHFGKKYADLSSVVDACLPALNSNGICVIQPTGENEFGRYVETMLIHGESGETLGCQVPLIVGKNDMQGYGSAVTYARRYGLMCMAGIAPEDDDGNAAAKAPPQAVSPGQYIKLRDKAAEADVDEDKICAAAKVDDLQQFPADQFDAAMKRLQINIDKNNKTDALDGDEIPH